MTTTEAAGRIREQYKARGWTSRMIGVKSRYYAGGSSIDVVIKDAAVDEAEVERIAKDEQHLRIDEGTGEVLMGGNRHVKIHWTREAQQQAAEPYLQAVSEAIEKLGNSARGTLIPVAERANGEPIYIGCSTPCAGCREYRVWGDQPGMTFTSDGSGSVFGAFHVALEVRRSLREAARNGNEEISAKGESGDDSAASIESDSAGDRLEDRSSGSASESTHLLVGGPIV